jgi:hypothetical protein
MKRLIAKRKEHRLFGRGSIEFLSGDNPRVLAFARENEGETVLVVANLSRYVQCARINLERFKNTVPTELFGRMRFPEVTDAPPDTPAPVRGCELALESVSPTELIEGQGDGGSRSAVVVVRGSNIAPDAKITITAHESETITPSLGVLPQVVVPADHVDNPFGEDVYYAGRLLPASFGRGYTTTHDDSFRGVLGLRGDYRRFKTRFLAPMPLPRALPSLTP